MGLRQGRFRKNGLSNHCPRKIRISKEPDERRQEIIETALELFSEKGYEDTTMQDIAERMDVSPGLCYRYFKSKTELFAAASEHYAIQSLEQIKIFISQNIPAVDKFNYVINRMFDFFINHHKYESKYQETSEIKSILLDNVANQWISVMIPIIEQGVNENVFHCNDISNTAKFLIFGIGHILHEEMPEENMQENIRSLLDFTKEMSMRVLKMKNE